VGLAGKRSALTAWVLVPWAWWADRITHH